MKICPFMSHMLGNEANVLEVGAHEDTVVWNEESSVGVGVKTKRKTETVKQNKQASHLYCLRDTCRFYRTRDGECTFDAILERTSHTEASTMAQKEMATSLARELDKFWQFQTKSAAEMISSFGEVEKRQEETLTRLSREIESRVARGQNEDEQIEHQQMLNTIRDNVSEIRNTIDARNDGFESLTTTVSDLVVGFEDSIKAMKEQWSQLSAQVAALEAMAPRVERVESTVTRSVENLERLERNWAELIDVVRSYEKKKAEEPAVNKGDRREAMKFNNLGVTSFHNGHFELARDQFLEAVRRDGSFAECFNNLGLVYSELGDEGQAATAFLKAIKLNPDLHAAYNNLGYVYYQQGDYERAVEMHAEAVSRSANNSSAYTNLGNAYFKLGNKKDAREAWKKAVELDPANEKAQRSLKTLID